MTTLDKLNQLRRKWGESRERIPNFDQSYQGPFDTLILLQDPGPQTEITGEVSRTNKDETARKIKHYIDECFEAEANNVLLWNAVPWILTGDITNNDLNEAKPFHEELLEVMKPDLRFVILLGVHARKLLVFISPLVGEAQIFGGHHTSARAMSNPERRAENKKLFRHIKTLL